MSEFPDRPAPPRSLAVRARGWIQWVGAVRLVASAVVALAVLAGAYWLVEPPPVTTEAKLPYATPASVGAPAASSVPSSTAGAASAVAEVLVVHVAGAVQAPGVYRLATGTRVIDAVQAAGGFAPAASSDAVNLAAPLADGQRVYVPRVGESPPLLLPSGGSNDTTPAGPVDLNAASAEELDALPGIGPTTASAIVAHREQHGPFATVDDLAEVRGIGPAKLDALRGLVAV